jgi:hypothetical protein
VILGGERVAHDVDRADLRFRRKPRADEAVHPDDGVPACHVQELLRHLVGIVGESRDLLPRQAGSERAARIGGGGHGVARHRQGLFNVLQPQDHDVPVVAGAEPHLAQDARQEAWKLRPDGVAARGRSCG